MINPYQPIAGAGAVTVQPSPLAQSMGNAKLAAGQPAAQPQMSGGQNAPAATGAGSPQQAPMTPQQQLAAAIIKDGQASQNAGALGLNLAADAVAQNSPRYGQQIGQALGGLFGLGQNQNQGGAGWGADANPSNGYYGSGYGSGWGS